MSPFGEIDPNDADFVTANEACSDILAGFGEGGGLRGGGPAGGGRPRRRGQRPDGPPNAHLWRWQHAGVSHHRSDRRADADKTHTQTGSGCSASERRPSRRRRRWLLLVVVVLVGGGLAGFLAFNNDEAPAPAAASVDFRFEEVTVTDLIEEQSYDATLGTTTADPIRTQLSGTITGVLQAGSTPAEGTSCSRSTNGRLCCSMVRFPHIAISPPRTHRPRPALPIG